MLRVGLTGGIGSGKSTVSRRLVQHGAVLVDSDVLARGVLAPGSDGLAEVVETFGAGVLDQDGALDRAALARVVFGDQGARRRLNAIVHPRVRHRSDELIAAAPADAVVVQDIPLLVENGMAPLFPLVVVVHAAAEERVRRLVQHRGMTEADARARIAAQADDEARRAAADVWLDNDGPPAGLDAAVDALWHDRLVLFEENLRLHRTVRGDAPALVDPDPGWAADAARIGARVAAAAGERGRGVEHIGPTAVPGLPAEPVIDLQLGTDSLADAEMIRDALQDAGFPALPDHDLPVPGGSAPLPGRFHGSADPGRVARLQVREVGSPGWRQALLVRDWLRADDDARRVAVARGTVTASGGQQEFHGALPHAEAWAATSGWVPSLHHRTNLR